MVHYVRVAPLIDTFYLREKTRLITVSNTTWQSPVSVK